MPEDHFGEDVVANYDESVKHRFASEVLGPAVEVLAELAGDGAALEFAAGTGRVALPLAERGVPVAGIELSPAMARRLRAKDPNEQVPVTLGDMTTTRVDGPFRLVYLVFNTIGNLTTQDEQVACFGNAAAHLEPGGLFVVEHGVPDLRRLPPGDDALVFAHRPGYVGYDHYVDLVAQQAVSHHFVTDGTAVKETTTPVPLRVAIGTRPHGQARRDGAAPPLGRLAPLALHRRQHIPCLRLAEGAPDHSPLTPPTPPRVHHRPAEGFDPGPTPNRRPRPLS